MRKLLIFLIILLSCSKQQAPELDFDYSYDQAYMASCNELNINKNVLQRDKTLILFKCLRWDKKFPSLFSSIEKIPTEDWNYFFSIFDKLFLNDKGKRNDFLKAFYNLDKNGGLDDLGVVLGSL
ncbi:MAG: hypothetical protein OEY33_07595, partial [Bdellovibrionales bacterium]|nr:hypothetical protein [Bdellovibrionales bacterium]